MPLWFFPALLALLAVSTLIAGIWLLLHLQALATLFRGRADIVPSPRRPHASRGALWLALAVFNIGWIGSIAVWTYTMTGEANEVIVQEE